MKVSPLERFRSFVEPAFRRPEFVQAAALCLREGKDGREVLIITSLGTRRWILPKGWPMEGRSLAGAALQEAWEEAGVIGHVDEVPVGYYLYEKKRQGDFGLSCRVELFRVHVADLAREWPERKLRRRRWVPLEKAARLVAEPGLAALLMQM
ncbi:MAG: NUDIX hydrolase [Pararhodobacter sp.]|nr:NUDIX hydrolase [Pararhodobacter sp.]